MTGAMSISVSPPAGFFQSKLKESGAVSCSSSRPGRTSWAEVLETATKVAAQAKTLDVMHSRIVNQRFQLRVLNELGRGLTQEEFLKAKAEVENEQTAKRIGDKPVMV